MKNNLTINSLLSKNNVVEAKTHLKKLKYTLVFTSLITINSLKFVSLFNNKLTKKYQNYNKIKLYLKQSYMLLTWIFYNNYSKKKIFIMPKKLKKFTITKSPMAHKTFSQEQLVWKEYNLLTPYEIGIKKKILIGIKNSLYFIKITVTYNVTL